MSIVRRSSPFGELLSLRQAMDRLFEDSYVRPRPGLSGGQDTPGPALDIYATQEALVVEAALPGIRPEDVEITSLGGTLTISGSTDDEQRREEQGYLYQEIRRGSFTRSVTLPGDVDVERAEATFENGMLRLTLPKREESKPRPIRITPSAQGTTHATADDGRLDEARSSGELQATESRPNGSIPSEAGARA
ncbi:Hsp20/alpha crystallin family protein [soil metagenome]